MGVLKFFSAVYKLQSWHQKCRHRKEWIAFLRWFHCVIGCVGTRYVSRDERKAKRWRWRGIGIASFIIRLPAISPASVIPHDLGGFSLRSKTLWDKTVQIEFDSYRLLYSAINLAFAIETHTSQLTSPYTNCTVLKQQTCLFFFSFAKVNENLNFTSVECR